MRSRNSKAGFAAQITVRAKDQHDRLIPLINIVFLLLTFFMLAGTFKVATQFDITPPVITTEGNIDQKNMVLQIAASGELAIADTKLSLESAIEKIKIWLAKDEDGELHIKADKNMKAQELLIIMQKLSDAQIQSVRLIAERKRE